MLGLAFKGGTDDVRESPAIAVIKSLIEEGCKIQAYDPAAGTNAREVLGTQCIEYVSSAMDAAKGADALLVLTDWDEFRSLDLAALHKALHYPIVIDGRNLFSPEAMAAHGFIYSSVGRPDISHELPGTPTGNGRAKSSYPAPVAHAVKAP